MTTSGWGCGQSDVLSAPPQMSRLAGAGLPRLGVSAAGVWVGEQPSSVNHDDGNGAIHSGTVVALCGYLLRGGGDVAPLITPGADGRRRDKSEASDRREAGGLATEYRAGFVALKSRRDGAIARSSAGPDRRQARISAQSHLASADRRFDSKERSEAEPRLYPGT